MFKNEEGVIKEVTIFRTPIQLDSGRQINFLNTDVLTGAVPFVKITSPTES